MPRGLSHRLEKYGSRIPASLGVVFISVFAATASIPIAQVLMVVLNGEIIENSVLVIVITSFTVSIPILIFIFHTIQSLVASRAHLAETRNELQARIVELAAARAEAEEANAAKSVFLAQMSHELRTPLNAVMGFSEVLMHREFVNPNMTMDDVANYGDMINHSGNLLLSLVNDVLDISKIEAGKLQLSPEPVRLGHAIETVCDCIIVMAAARGSRIKFDRHFDDFELMIDRRALDQMLLNLLSNAVKFSPDKSEIAVRLHLDNQKFSISVINPGKGMTPDEISKAVEPFAQLSSAMIASQKGTGLGLTIVRSLIELEGGELLIESTPDVETTVAIHYPIHSVINTQYSAVSNA